MKSIFVCLILISTTLLSYSQDSIKVVNNILKTSKLNKGVYFSFNDFKENSPDSKKQFSLDKNADYYTFLVQNENNTLLTENEVWGISTGDSIYINNLKFSKNKGFKRLIKLGYPYSYFKGTSSNSELSDVSARTLLFGVIIGAVAVAASFVPQEYIVLLNMKTGEFYVLNDANFEKLLQNDADLMHKYEKILKIEDNDQFMYQLLDEYNIKHKNL